MNGDDEAAFHMLAGAEFLPGTRVVMPSGEVMSGKEFKDLYKVVTMEGDSMTSEPKEKTVMGTPRFAQMPTGAKAVVFALGIISGVIVGGALALLVALFRAAIVWAWGLV